MRSLRTVSAFWNIEKKMDRNCNCAFIKYYSILVPEIKRGINNYSIFPEVIVNSSIKLDEILLLLLLLNLAFVNFLSRKEEKRAKGKHDDTRFESFNSSKFNDRCSIILSDSLIQRLISAPKNLITFHFVGSASKSSPALYPAFGWK